MPDAIPDTQHINARPISFVRALRAIWPAILFWAILVGGSAYLFIDRSHWAERYDLASLREWFEEDRPFRKNLSELLDDYVSDPDERADEIEDQLKAMVDPLITYRNQLPLFLDIYTIRISFPNRPDLQTLEWQSPARPLRAQQDSQVRWEKMFQINCRNGTAALVECEYRMHAYHKVQEEEAERQKWVWVVSSVVLGGGLFASLWVFLFLRRERRRELANIAVAQSLERAETLRLAEELRAQEAERAREELNTNLLHQKLEASRQENRAAEAEKIALEMKSQIYASIGIMAGSYAHNIKNLLVRPNDLLSRCLNNEDRASENVSMLEEVRSTLGTVTERLQQILRTVRRDPNSNNFTDINLNFLVQETEKYWSSMAHDKWKINLTAEVAPDPLLIQGDESHLQQALENLLFNARDATFEMRNHIRKSARHLPDPAQRKQAILDASSWLGLVQMRTYLHEDRAVLEVRDNGIGMSEAVRVRCLETHFSTKRDNALYEGYSAGMGLGLSFVVMVLEHHHAQLTVVSQPEQGSLFRIEFPLSRTPLPPGKVQPMPEPSKPSDSTEN